MTALHLGPCLRLYTYNVVVASINRPALRLAQSVNLRCGRINRGSLSHKLPSATARIDRSKLTSTSPSVAGLKWTTSGP